MIISFSVIQADAFFTRSTVRVRWSQQLDVAPSTLAFEMLSRFTFLGCLGCSGSIRRVSCWSNDDQPHSSRGAQHVTVSGTPKILVCLGVAAMRIQGMYDARNAHKNIDTDAAVLTSEAAGAVASAAHPGSVS